uniref:Putative secreted protein n=1 Tax=Anopheles darlingi TaxID=43151 RepID=A0A2M4DBT4_ANODA
MLQTDRFCTSRGAFLAALLAASSEPSQIFTPAPLVVSWWWLPPAAHLQPLSLWRKSASASCTTSVAGARSSPIRHAQKHPSGGNCERTEHIVTIPWRYPDMGTRFPQPPYE